MPVLGLGTWRLNDGDEVKDAVKTALLEANYNAVDTAYVYKNEAGVGEALEEIFSSGAKNRAEIFVTTKLSWVGEENAHGHGVPEALRSQLNRLRLEYVDLFLIHTPKGGDLLLTWHELLRCREAGLCRSVGVSNFSLAHLKEMKAAGVELPEVVQNEFHVWHQHRELRRFCHQEGIVFTGYCPLGRGFPGGACPEPGDEKAAPIVAAARRHGKSWAQVLIKWSLQMGAVTIPRSSNQEHIKQNADMEGWELTGAEMTALSELEQPTQQNVHEATPWAEVCLKPRRGAGRWL